MNDATKVLIGLAATLALGGVCAGVYASHQEEMAALWHRQAQSYAKDAEEAARRATASAHLAEEYKVKANESAARADEAQAKLAKLRASIPKPKPAPEEDSELAAGMAGQGLQHGLKVLGVTEPAPSTLAHQDALTVWNWQQQAAMVPMLRSSLDTCGEALKLRTDEAQGLRTALLFEEQARDGYKEAANDQRKRAEAGEREVNALTKSVKAQKWQKWAMAAGGVLAGYFAGRAIR